MLYGLAMGAKPLFELGLVMGFIKNQEKFLLEGMGMFFVNGIYEPSCIRAFGRR